MPDKSIEDMQDIPSGVPPWPDRPQYGGESHQIVKTGGQYVMEIGQAAAVTGRDHGYLSRTLSTFAMAGCTCGWFADGPASEVKPAFEAHAKEHP